LDIISKRGFVGKNKEGISVEGEDSGRNAVTLAERVLKSFVEIKVNKKSAKIPKIGKVPFDASIIQILIKTAAEQSKIKSKDEKKDLSDTSKQYKVIKEEKDIEGGYGASRAYSAGKVGASYLDYGRLFSYLGKFKAFSNYFSAENTISPENSSQRQTSELDTIEKGARHVKYMANNHEINTISAVPIAGMDSAEWEKFKLWMKLDPVMYRLKTSTS